MPGKQANKNPAIPKQTIPVSDKNAVSGPEIKIANGIPKWAPVAVIILTAILYFPSLQNGITSFDDDFYILKNPFLRDHSWQGIVAIFTSYYAGNYHPLTTLTYLFEFSNFGDNPLPYHILNLALHLANTWLVLKLAEKLSGRKITALVVCVLFAVHPMHVESVAWISERKDVLYTLFYLWALLVYLRYMEQGNKRKYYLLTLLLFLASLLSKSAAVTLPLLMIAIDVYKGRKINGRSIGEKVPFFLLSILFGLLNLQSQAAQGAITDLGAAYSIINRIFLFTSNLSMYFIKLVAPYNLSLLHFYPGENKGMLPLLFYFSLPLILLLTWLILRKNKFRTEILFGVSFFMITISVMLQVVAVGSAFYSERYTYVPYIGLFYITGQLITHASGSKLRYFVYGIFALFILAFSVITWNRIPVWKNDESLFGDIRKKDPKQAIGMSNAVFFFGYTKETKNDLPGALYDYTQAILFNPGLEDAYLKRGVVNFALHNYDSAISDYSKALRFKPNSDNLFNLRGWAYFQAGDTLAALNDYNRALALNPGLTDALNNRGWLYFCKGNPGAAIEDYKKVIAVELHNVLAYNNLAGIASNMGDYSSAIEYYDSIIKINPKENGAHHDLGIVKLKLKDTAGACGEWKKAAELGNREAAQLVKQYGR